MMVSRLSLGTYDTDSLVAESLHLVQTAETLADDDHPELYVGMAQALALVALVDLVNDLGAMIDRRLRK